MKGELRIGYSFLLGPSIAALAMSGSSALVAINALMLKRTKLTSIHQRGANASVAATQQAGKAPATAATPQLEKAGV